LAAAFQASQSGRGFRLLDAEQLRDFAVYTRTQEAVVCNVETFEVTGEYTIARIDLSIYQGGVDMQMLPAAERVALSEEAVRDVLAAIEREGISCVFQVWADELQTGS
jgi:hypothetical protein